MYPPVVNSHALVEVAKRAVTTAFGASAWREMPPLMIGEDFSFFCEEMPCVMLFSGHRKPGDADGEHTGSAHHAPTFEIDEDSLPYGMGALVGTALAMLEDESVCRPHGVEMAGGGGFQGRAVQDEFELARAAARSFGSARAG